MDLFEKLFLKKTPVANNYYLKDLVAYTEDHIPVQMLYMYGMPPPLTTTMLQDHFAIYGKVLLLHICPRFYGFPRHENTGFVLFAKKTDAVRALVRRIHYLKEFKFNVVAADSWHQPDADELPRHLSVCLLNTQTPPPAVMILNDDCLEHIMMYLTLQDQVHFARTCLRFRAVYQAATARLHKIVNMSQFVNMTVWDMRDFFWLSGAHVQQLSGQIPMVRSKRFCAFLFANCTNLQTMDVSITRLSGGYIIEGFAKMHKFESLRLNLNDKYGYLITGDRILYKNVCPEDYDQYEFEGQLSRLSHLQIDGHELSIKLFEELVKYKAGQLKRLEILGRTPISDELINIANLSELRDLCLPDIESDAAFAIGLYANLKKLERFTLDNSNNVSDTTILQLFVGCRKLSYIGLKKHTSIGEKLVRGIVSLVKKEIAKKKMQRKLPIELLTRLPINNPKMAYLKNLSKDIIQFTAYSNKCKILL